MKEEDIIKEIEQLEKRKALLLRLETLRHEVSVMEKAELSGSEAKVVLRVIAEATCAEFGADFGNMLSRSREDAIVVPRQIVFYISRQKRISLHGIGNAMRRNHATVMYGVRSLQNRMDTDKAFAERVQKVMRRVDEQLNGGPIS